MKSVKPSSMTNDYKGYLDGRSANTILFDNSCVTVPYTNQDIAIVSVSEKNIQLWESLVIQHVLPRLKPLITRVAFDDEKQKKYRFNPKALSYDLYQTVDHWYIILALNGYLSTFDFYDFTALNVVYGERNIIKIVDEELYYYGFKQK